VRSTHLRDYDPSVETPKEERAEDKPSLIPLVTPGHQRGAIDVSARQYKERAMNAGEESPCLGDFVLLLNV